MNSEELANALEEKRAEMIRLAAGMLRRHGLAYEAEDFVQDATIKILNGVAEDRYTMAEGVGGLFPHIIIDLIRDRVRIGLRREELTDEYTRIYQPDSQAHMQQRERLKIDVELALVKLESKTSQIVRLVWMEGLNYRQTMRRLKITDRTITTSLEEALPILQRELARYDHRWRSASIEPQERVSASQAPYKEEADETDSDAALQAAMDEYDLVETAEDPHHLEALLASIFPTERAA